MKRLTPPSAQNRERALQVQGRRAYTQAELDLINALVREGWNAKDIAKRLGRTTVQHALKRDPDYRERLLKKTMGASSAKRVLADARRALTQRNERACLCCRQPFISQGPHNRLCDRCRRQDDGGPYGTPASVLGR